MFSRFKTNSNYIVVIVRIENELRRCETFFAKITCDILYIQYSKAAVVSDESGVAVLLQSEENIHR